MLVNDNDALNRINSPFNLLNKLKLDNEKLKKETGLDLFKNKIKVDNLVKPLEIELPREISRTNVTGDELGDSAESQSSSEDQSSSPQSSPSIDDLIDNAENQIKLSTAHNKALAVLNSAMDEMKLQLSSIKPERLPSVITATSKVVESIRKERAEANKQRGNNSVHFHFYTPQQKELSDYEVVEVG